MSMTTEPTRSFEDAEKIPPHDRRPAIHSFKLLKNRINEKQLKTQKASWTARLKALTAAH